ncbi:MAG TPA: menaquinone biosynthesis protein [Candidatus Saccharimonadales bacterium]|nr:menaquinone biosynthesis protein [Candidatus Saccharimonadales bacterium]
MIPQLTGRRTSVGRIAYLNTDPFFEALDLGDAEVVAAPPRELARLCREGRLDAGALPVAELFRMEEAFEPLGQMGIAVAGPVDSVLCFARVPFEQLGGREVALTADSSTSVCLLRLLLEQHLGARPAAYRRGPAERADAFLAIGDTALRLGHAGAAGFPHVLDLARAWQAWQGLPFVFARWAVRRALPEAEKRALAVALSQALDRGLERAGDIAARRSPDLGVPAASLEAYLRRFRYRFGEEEARAEARFRQLLHDHHLDGFDPR